MDEKVTSYIGRFSKEQQKVAERLRDIVLSMKVKEEFRWGVPMYEGKYYLYCGKKGNVNLGVSIKGMDEKVIKELSGKGKFMRTLVFYSEDEIDEKKVKRILKQVKIPVEEREM